MSAQSLLHLKRELENTYEIQDTLGQGAYGAVKKVIHKGLNEERALKILKKSNLESVKDFLNEIEMLKTIDHPNVLKYYEYFEDKNYYYIITEYCSGGEIMNYIKDRKGISEDAAAIIMKQLLSAVAYCHQKGIVHRDLKAANLLFKHEVTSDSEMMIKVIDFGISCKIEPQ